MFLLPILLAGGAYAAYSAGEYVADATGVNGDPNLAGDNEGDPWIDLPDVQIDARPIGRGLALAGLAIGGAYLLSRRRK